MARTDLGPSFPLDEATLRRAIQWMSPGVHVCGRLDGGAFEPEHVGRSDGNIAEAVRGQIGRYSRFKFGYCDTPGEAFRKECALYHDLAERIDNDVHPAPAPGMETQCPICMLEEGQTASPANARDRRGSPAPPIRNKREGSQNDIGRPRSNSRRRGFLERHVLARAVQDGENEQDLVRSFLGDAPGTFAEVGAFEPVRMSQTYHLEVAGWSGVLVEPVAEFADRLRKTRRASVFAVVAGAPENEGREVELLVAGALSTVKPPAARVGAAEKDVRSVPVRTLDSILAQAEIARLDFLSIDVEGAEIEVLRGISLDRYRPRLILLEDHVLRLAKHRYLVGQGYKLVRRTGLNNWYVPNEKEFAISLWGRIQLMRKLYLGLYWRRYRYFRGRSAGALLVTD